jgi:hypothetical protein
MNAIQIQDLITKIGEFNLHLDLQYYFDKGEEILKSEFEKVEELNSNLEDKLLIQLRENGDVELLQNFMVLAGEKENALMVLYHQFRSQLADPNNTNPVNDISIPIVCTIIDYKLDSLSTIKKDLHTKIAFYKYKISSDFNNFSETLLSPNLNINNGTAGRATFRLSKKDSLMLLFILEEKNILKFENNAQRKSFIEQNFNFTEVRKNGSYGKSVAMTGIQSEYSKFNSNDRNELKSNSKTLENLSTKLTTLMEEFKFTKK